MSANSCSRIPGQQATQQPCQRPLLRRSASISRRTAISLYAPHVAHTYGPGIVPFAMGTHTVLRTSRTYSAVKAHNVMVANHLESSLTVTTVNISLRDIAAAGSGRAVNHYQVHCAFTSVCRNGTSVFHNLQEKFTVFSHKDTFTHPPSTGLNPRLLQKLHLKKPETTATICA